jgi:5-aminopentanamidase
MRVGTLQKTVAYDKLEVMTEGILRDLHYCDVHALDIVCFPECYLTGYYLGLEEITRYALSLDSVEFKTFLGACSSFRTTFIIGLIEKTDTGFYNTAIVVSKGNLLGTYRKTHPNEKHFLAGENFPVFQCNSVTFGINICNDANYPDAASVLAKQGARLLFFPLNNRLPQAVATTWRTKSLENLQRRAKENNCWVVSSDVVGGKDSWLSYGCSQIVSPTGNVVGCVPEGQEGCAIFELDLRHANHL